MEFIMSKYDLRGLIARVNKLEKHIDDMKEFVEDCAVSHTETRYKYKAQAILAQLKGKDEKDT